MLLTQKELAEKIKSGKFFSVYILYGEEEFLKNRYVERLVRGSVLEEFLILNYKKSFFEDLSLEDLETFLNMAPVFSYKRVFVLKNVNISKITAKDLKAFKRIIGGMPRSSILVIDVIGRIYDIKKSSNFKKICELNDSCVVEFGFKSERWLCSFFLKHLNKKGFSIEMQDLLFLVRRCGRSIKALKIELEKICSYVLKGVITREDILKMTSPIVEVNVFNITKSLVAGRKEEAIKIFNDMSAYGVDMSQIFTAILCSFLDLYRAKCAKLKGLDSSEILKYYDYKGREFRIKNAILNCNSISIERLREDVKLLAELDVAVKTKPFKKEHLVEMFLFFCKIC